MQKLLLVCVALVLALGVTWYVVSGGDAGRREAAGFAPALEQKEPAAPAATDEPELVADEQIADARVEQPAIANPSAAATGEAASAATTKYALTGRIVDPGGEPIAGAELSLDHGRNFGFFGGAREEAHAAEARSDEAGRFRLETAERGAVRMHASASRFAPGTVDIVVHGGAEQNLGDIPLSRGVVLAGTVIDSAGKPVPGAKVRRPDDRIDVRFPGMDSAAEIVATTDERGRFEIDRQSVGPWRLLVTSEDHPDEAATGETKFPGEEQRDLFVELEDGTTIQGRVLGAPQEPAQKLVVRASEVRGSPDAPTFDADFFGEWRQAVPDASGAFAVRGVRIGNSYRLSLSIEEPWWGGSRSAPVTARAGDGGVELVYSPGTTLVFQVVDGKTGLPVPGFTAEAGIDWTDTLKDERGETRTQHPDGHARFEGLRPRGNNDQARLVIDAVGYERYEHEPVRVAHQGEVDLGRIVLASMPVVRVHVRDTKSGEPVAGARVGMRTSEQGQPPVRGRQFAVRASRGGGDFVRGWDDSESATSDENGVAVLRSMPGRIVVISIDATGYATWKSGDVGLPAAEDLDHEALLSRGGSARVLARDATGAAVAGMGVRHRAAGEAGPTMISFGGGPQPDATTDETGAALFENLAPGRHLFQLQEQKPTVPGGGLGFVMASPSFGSGEDEAGWTEGWVAEGETAEIVLVARARGSLSGTVTEGGSALAGARVSLEEPGSDGGMPMPFSGSSGPSARTDGEGRFLFDDLAAGDYVLVVDHDARAMEERLEVSVDVGENERDVVLPVAIVEGRVTDQDGEPIAGAKVKVDRVQPTGGSPFRFAVRMAAGDDEESGTILGGMGADKRTTTDADGRYVLRGVASDVELEVEVTHADYQSAKSKSFTLAADEVMRDRDVELVEGGRIEATVRQPDGTAAQMSVVRADFRGESETTVQPVIELSNREGKAVLKSLRPGNWEVSILNRGSPDDQNVPPPQTIEVKPGETSRVTLDLP